VSHRKELKLQYPLQHCLSAEQSVPVARQSTARQVQVPWVQLQIPDVQ
jgi:hypothetical protein